MVEIEELENGEEVEKWIRAFKRVMRKCPKNIWFFCGTGCNIMVTGKDGEPVYKDNYGVDPDYLIDNEDTHLWEGGDW